MKTEVIDVSETEKNLVVEIPSAVVDAEIDRVTRNYGRAAKIPGFRPGKVPARVVRQRFRDQILHDVAHDLIPRAIDEALRERGQEPVNTPDVRDVSLLEGQPLKFTAAFETVPPIDPGDYQAIVLRKPEVALAPDAVDDALERLRGRAAKFEPVEDRPAQAGDFVTLDLERKRLSPAKEGSPDDQAASKHEDITIEIGGSANPPGLDEQLVGTEAGAEKTFVLTYPSDYANEDLAGAEVEYVVKIKSIKRKVLPALDDELAKDLGDFESLEQLRTRVEDDLLHEAKHEADRELRNELMKQLAARVTFTVPSSLVEREVDRRIEEFVRRLIEQQIDPMRTNINWEDFRERQREGAAEAVRSTLVLDEVARREGLAVTESEVDQEIERYAERSSRTASAIRARLEKEGGISRIYLGLRREKSIDLLMSRVTIVAA